MKKIPSLFVRDYERIPKDGIDALELSKKGRFLATEQVTPGCEWVINGEGVATRKWDGTAILKEGASLYKRYDAKHGKTPPEHFRPCQDPDPVTGHWPGWIPVNPNDPADRWICEAYSNSKDQCTLDGTYEVFGPKINGNKERLTYHRMVPHDAYVYREVERTYDGIKSFLLELEVDGVLIEGIVFHHPDGRMCKVKRSDFGLPW